jgi:predicted RecA/RadA family phage recombinase
MTLELRSNKWESFIVTAPTAEYTKGEFLKIEDTVGVIVEDAKFAEETAFIYKCEKILLPKATGNAFSAGDKVYLSSGKINTTGTLCGICLEAAASDDETILVALDGTLSIAS